MAEAAETRSEETPRWLAWLHEQLQPRPWLDRSKPPPELNIHGGLSLVLHAILILQLMVGLTFAVHLAQGKRWGEWKAPDEGWVTVDQRRVR